MDVCGEVEGVSRLKRVSAHGGISVDPSNLPRYVSGAGGELPFPVRTWGFGSLLEASGADRTWQI